METLQIFARIKGNNFMPVFLGCATKETKDQYTEEAVKTYGDRLIGVYSRNESLAACYAIKRLHRGPAC